MKRMMLFFIFFVFSPIITICNEGLIKFNYTSINPHFNNNFYSIKHNNLIIFFEQDASGDNLKNNKKKINMPIIFRDISLDWLKEKNRLEKILLSTGVVSFSVGAGILLAGIINHFVTFNAQTELSKNASYALIGVGSGLSGSGIPFILVGSIKLGINTLKEKKLSTP